MLEIRKTDVYANWLDSLRDADARLVYWYESSDWRTEIQEMPSL